MQRLLALLFVFFYSSSPVLAYAPLRQSDWSGGYGQQVWSDPTKFNEYYNLKYQTQGELTIDQKPNNWYDPAWVYRKKITFNNKGQNEDLKDFPVLIKLEHKVNIDYYKTQHNTGTDIRFTDSDGKTLLSHEIESWDQGDGSFIWVKVPQIDKDSDTDYIYMYYGNPTAQDAQSVAKVWDDSFKMVQHFEERPKAANEKTYDSTKNDNDATLRDSNNDPGSGVLGQIGFAHQFGGTTADDFRITDTTLTDTLDFDTGQEFTVSVWARMEGTGGITQYFVSDVINQSGGRGGGYLMQFISQTLSMSVFDGAGDSCGVRHSRNLENNTWHYLTAIMYRRASCTTSDILLYIDGTAVSTTLSGAPTPSTNQNISNTLETSLGSGTNTGNNPLRGKMDEVRISNTPRSPEWIKAEYLTETYQFQTYSHEELFGSELLSSIFDADHGNNWGYLSYTADEPEKTAARVKVRTGNNMYLADAPDFETCDSIINKSDISSNKCVVDGHRYIQYQVILDTQEAAKTPIFKSISITDYLPHPVVKGISTVASPSPLPSVIYDLESPQAGPRPSPSLDPKPYWLDPIFDFLEALFH